jgi:hypothetical protein
MHLLTLSTIDATKNTQKAIFFKLILRKLHGKWMKPKEFVLKEINNVIQGKKMLQMINEVKG